MEDLVVNCLLVVASCLLNADAQLTPLSIIGRPANQSGFRLDLPSRALDGNLTTYQHTGTRDPHPWWQVDLGHCYCLGRVTVHLRQDCCDYEVRHTGALVRAGQSAQFADNQPCGSPATEAQSAKAGATIVSLCEEPRWARYVSVDIDKSQPDLTNPILHMAEVEVAIYPDALCSGYKDVPVCGRHSKDFARLVKGALIANTVPLSYREASRVTLCAVHCIHTAGCLSFDFAPSNRQCRLYSLNATAIEHTPSHDSSIYVMI